MAQPFTPQDAHWMAQALRLAERGLFSVRPNPAVGCVLVRDGQLVGQGWHQRAGTPHAEVHALRDAGDQARGATAYVTLEPCAHHGRTPPCADALVAARVARVVVAMTDPNPLVAGQGLARLASAGVEVASGLMEASARQLNPGFLSRMERGRPFVRLKLAASLDGRTALANGDSQWITSEAARADVQWLRARSGAILTGVNTVLADDPSLTVRLDAALLGQKEWQEVERQPLRIIADSQLRTPPGARLLRLPGSVVVLGCQDSVLDKRLRQVAALEAAGARVVAMPCHQGRLLLSPVMDWLGREAQINDLLIEAGATLAGAAVQAGLVDELWWYAAPCLMGSDARAGVVLPPLNSMQQVGRWQLTSLRPVGSDWRAVLLPQVDAGEGA